MRALIADRKPLIREALAALIRTRLPRIEVVTAPTLSDGTSLMGRAPFGVLILEAGEVAGDRLLEAIRLIHPGWRMVMLSHEADAGGLGTTTFACDAHWHGETDSDTMVADLLRLSGGRVAAGQPWPAPAPAFDAPASPPVSLAAMTASGAGPGEMVEAGEAGMPARALTRRQQDVLGLLSEGRSTKEIARSLNLGVGTIKAHLDGLYRTLGVHNRTAAVSLARQITPARGAGSGNVIRLDARSAPRGRTEPVEPAAMAG